MPPLGCKCLGGNVAGIIAPIVTGYIVAATGQFDAAFTIAGTLLALGAVISLAFTRGSIGEAANENVLQAGRAAAE
jgi:ACS family glucarate transporter-like MFS transporter